MICKYVFYIDFARFRRDGKNTRKADVFNRWLSHAKLDWTHVIHFLEIIVFPDHSRRMWQVYGIHLPNIKTPNTLTHVTAVASVLLQIISLNIHISMSMEHSNLNHCGTIIKQSFPHNIFFRCYSWLVPFYGRLGPLRSLSSFSRCLSPTSRSPRCRAKCHLPHTASMQSLVTTRISFTFCCWESLYIFILFDVYLWILLKRRVDPR